MKKAIQELPHDYKKIFSVNLQKTKKVAIFVNIFGLLIAIAMAVPMHFYVPITSLFDMSGGLIPYVIRLGALIISMIVYMILHELVHGIAMKSFGTKKVKYGFTGLYAYAGSSDYYGKTTYIIISLAPVIVWGVIIAIVNIFVPIEWFWVVYIIQICNISGAAGDMYVTAKFSKMPRDILVHDSGIEMTVYSKEESTLS